MIPNISHIPNYHDLVEAFARGERRTCPLCETPVTGVTLYDKSEPQTYGLYVEPCGHYLGLWPGAPQWCQAAGMVKILEPRK